MSVHIGLAFVNQKGELLVGDPLGGYETGTVVTSKVSQAIQRNRIPELHDHIESRDTTPILLRNVIDFTGAKNATTPDGSGLSTGETYPVLNGSTTCDN